MKLFRFISAEEAQAIIDYDIIEPIQSKPKGRTTLPSDVLYFLEYRDLEYITNEAHLFLMGIVDDDYLVIIDKPDDEIIEGYGTYADLASDDWDDTVQVKEYGVYSYSIEDVVALYKVNQEPNPVDSYISLDLEYSKTSNTVTEQVKPDDKVEIAPNIYLRDSGIDEYIKTLYYIEDGKTKSLLDYFYKGDNIFISDVVTFHPYKGKGYATKLLKQLIKLFPDKTLELYVVPGYGVNAEYLIDWYKDVFGFEVVEGYEDGLIVDDEVIMKRHPTNNLNEQTRLSDIRQQAVRRIISLYAPSNLVDQYVEMFYEYLDKFMSTNGHKYETDYDYFEKVKQLASVWIQAKINLNLYENTKIENRRYNMDRIIITDMTYDDMYELAYERAAEAYDGPELNPADDEYFDERVHNEIEEIFYEEVHEIYDAEDLKRWFLDHGWTLDRGYGGPNYKERLAEEKNWDLLLELMLYSGKEKDDMFGAVVYTPVEVNDMVLFAEDDFEEDYNN